VHDGRSPFVGKGAHVLFGLFDRVVDKMGDFIYRPITYWGRLFSPTFNFGCNVEDEGIEAHVKSEVGSYGKQINRLMDAVEVIIAQAAIDVAALPLKDRQAITKFQALARSADDAARSYSRDLAIQQARDLVGELKGLRASKDEADQKAYAAVVKKLNAVLPASRR
jgi:hypothetical protein